MSTNVVFDIESRDTLGIGRFQKGPLQPTWISHPEQKQHILCLGAGLGNRQINDVDA